MENTEKNVNKVTETLTKELEGMSNEGLRDFFMFFYKLNHQHYNMITPEKFEEFLEAFEKNPFKVNEDKAFRKQLIENIIKYAYDHICIYFDDTVCIARMIYNHRFSKQFINTSTDTYKCSVVDSIGTQLHLFNFQNLIFARGFILSYSKKFPRHF